MLLVLEENRLVVAVVVKLVLGVFVVEAVVLVGESLVDDVVVVIVELVCVATALF
jgi:hypothetical protein